MKLRLAAVLGGLIVVLWIAGGVVRKADTGASCPAPVTRLLEVDTGYAQTDTAAWVAENAAPSFKHPGTVGWALERTPFVYAPGRIDALVIVGEGYTQGMFGITFSGPTRVYRVKMSRSCAASHWHVDSAVRVP